MLRRGKGWRVVESSGNRQFFISQTELSLCCRRTVARFVTGGAGREACFAIIESNFTSMAIGGAAGKWLPRHLRVENDIQKTAE
jgi:hypothetical protein